MQLTQIQLFYFLLFSFQHFFDVSYLSWIIISIQHNFALSVLGKTIEAWNLISDFSFQYFSYTAATGKQKVTVVEMEELAGLFAW